MSYEGDCKGKKLMQPKKFSRHGVVQWVTGSNAERTADGYENTFQNPDKSGITTKKTIASVTCTFRTTKQSSRQSTAVTTQTSFLLSQYSTTNFVCCYNAILDAFH
jgi:hypothetical protein